MVTSDVLASHVTSLTIWPNHDDPARSRVVSALATGEVSILDLNGKIVSNLDGATGVTALDVQTDVSVDGKTLDLLALAESSNHRLRFFILDRKTGEAQDVTGKAPVFVGKEEGITGVSGLGIFQRADGTLFVVVDPVGGPTVNSIAQYRIAWTEDGKVDLSLERTFGKSSAKPDTEGQTDTLAIDDEGGFVYVLEPSTGIRKFPADPDAADAQRDLAFFATSGFSANRQGLALFKLPERGGFVLTAQDLGSGANLRLFPRVGPDSNPHEHALSGEKTVAGVGRAGLEASAHPLGTQFPNGLLVMSDEKGDRVLYFDWGQIAQNPTSR